MYNNSCKIKENTQAPSEERHQVQLSHPSEASRVSLSLTFVHDFHTRCSSLRLSLQLGHIMRTKGIPRMRTRFLAPSNDSSSCYNPTHPLDLSSSLPYAFSFSISPSTDSAQDTEVLLPSARRKKKTVRVNV